MFWLVIGTMLFGYVAQRLIEGAFIVRFGMHIHVWERFDSWFRLITARRNPNMVILFFATLVGRPDTGLVLMGFSQGAMTALHVGLSLPKPLLGIIAVAGAFLPAEDFESAGYAKPPVCLVHGDRDDVVEPRFSRDAADQLKAAGVPVQYQVSPGGGHGISPDGLEFAIQFIRGLNT